MSQTRQKIKIASHVASCSSINNPPQHRIKSIHNLINHLYCEIKVKKKQYLKINRLRLHLEMSNFLPGSIQDGDSLIRQGTEGGKS